MPDQGGVLDVGLPSWRPDCELEIDVDRGDRPPRTATSASARRCRSPSCPAGSHPIQARRRLLRQVLYGLGISEAMPIPFLAPGDLDRAGLDRAALTIANPLVAEESVLRTSLRPGLLKAVAYNESHRHDGVALFEIGHVYRAGARVRCPTSARCSASRSAGREGPAAVPVLAGGGRRARAGRPDAAGRGRAVPAGVLPGMHPGGAAS